jgi:hypothetical protein
MVFTHLAHWDSTRLQSGALSTPNSSCKVYLFSVPKDVLHFSSLSIYMAYCWIFSINSLRRTGFVK